MYLFILKRHWKVQQEREREREREERERERERNYCFAYWSVAFMFMSLSFFRLGAIRWTGPEVMKLFSYSIQLSTKFILLINVKMPTIGILTFISMINKTSERPKARNFFICRNFSSHEQLKFLLSWVEHEKSFIPSGPVAFVEFPIIFICFNWMLSYINLFQI